MSCLPKLRISNSFVRLLSPLDLLVAGLDSLLLSKPRTAEQPRVAADAGGRAESNPRQALARLRVPYSTRLENLKVAIPIAIARASSRLVHTLPTASLAKKK